MLQEKVANVAHGWLPSDQVAMYDKRRKANRHRQILLDLRLLADLLNLDLPHHLRETKVKTEVTGGTKKSISHVTNAASERLSAASAPPMPEQAHAASPSCDGQQADSFPGSWGGSGGRFPRPHGSAGRALSKRAERGATPTPSV